jgi:hypothetical protein
VRGEQVDEGNIEYFLHPRQAAAIPLEQGA